MPDEGGGSDQLLRFLGLAFAGADLVFEIDPHGAICFALGAAERLTGRRDATLKGLDWRELFEPQDAPLLDALLRGLGAADRRGPLPVTLRATADAAGRSGSLSIFHLPERAERISCALSLGQGGRAGSFGETGLVEKAAFADGLAGLLEEAESAGLDLRLDLVELPGFGDALADLAPADSTRRRQEVAALLRAESYAGSGAAEVSADRFALVRPASATDNGLSQRLEASSGVAPVTAQLALECATAAQNARAMRYALDRYIEDGAGAAAHGFKALIEQTVRDTAKFKAIVATGAFNLAFQPVVSLSDETLHHFEALARFEPSASPAESIRLAEELDMIADFDLSVARAAVRALGAGAQAGVAANVSARSLTKDSFVTELMALSEPSHRSRLFLEITETHKIGDQDVERVRTALGALRKLGHPLCIDDFGAGAASLDYLRQLDVDYVKIDGRFIQDLASQSRSATIVRHVAAMCDELGMITVAEMIETREVLELCRELGVKLGQGWVFSKPLSQPRWTPPKKAAKALFMRGRRSGATQEWC